MLTLVMDVLPMLEATNRQTPTGGVVSPIIKFSTAITEKCIGSTPTVMATFNKIGKRIRSAATVSMNVPTKINRRLIKSSTMYLFVLKSSISFEIYCGILSVIRIQPNRFAKPTNTIRDAEVFMESKMMT